MIEACSLLNHSSLDRETEHTPHPVPPSHGHALLKTWQKSKKKKHDALRFRAQVVRRRGMLELEKTVLVRLYECTTSDVVERS
jgi:hypothetical protein